MRPHGHGPEGARGEGRGQRRGEGRGEGRGYDRGERGDRWGEGSGRGRGEGRGEGRGRRGGRDAFQGGRIRRGEVRDLLLAALIEGPAHGYELIRRLEERSGGRWRPSPGSVYPLLQLFVDEGLVVASDVDGRKVFELSERGSAVADESRLLALAEAHDGTRTRLRSELEQLRAATRQVGILGNPAMTDAAVEIVRGARQAMYRLLAGDLPPAAAPSDGADTAAAADGTTEGKPGV